MISLRLSVAFILVILSTIADTNIEESLEMRIFDSNFKPSKSQMVASLKKADLKGHGYEKEVSNELVNIPGTNQKVYRKTYFYYKTVNCSRIWVIEQEINSLMSGVFKQSLESKLKREITTRKLANMKRCQVGVEIHFHKGCFDKNRSVRRPRNVGGDCNGCTNCTVVKLFG